MTASGAGDATWVLAIDTATSRIVVAGGRLDGTTLAVRTEPAGFRHGELLLAEVEGLMAQAGLTRGALGGIVVGTGPGAFTGLRVGLATAKTIAHALNLPIVGVSTATALLRAADRAAGRREASHPDGVLLLPAGPRERSIVRDGTARLLADPTELESIPAALLIAVDLDGRAPEPAVARGRAALEGLGPALVEIGAGRLAAGDVDDAADLVPDYVTLPRGVLATTGVIEWQSDSR